MMRENDNNREIDENEEEERLLLIGNKNCIIRNGWCEGDGDDESSSD